MEAYEEELFTDFSKNEFLSETQKENLKRYAKVFKKYREGVASGPNIWPKYTPMQIESIQFDETEGTVILKARKIPNPDPPKIKMSDFWPKQ